MAALKRNHEGSILTKHSEVIDNDDESDEELFSIVRASASVPYLGDEIEEHNENEVSMSESLRQEYVSSDEDSGPKLSNQRKSIEPAWTDEDDIQSNVDKKVSAVFGVTPDFLNITEFKKKDIESSSSDSSDDDSTSDNDNDKPPKATFYNLMSKEKNPRLKKDLLDIKQCLDANIDQRSKARLSTVLFHPKIEALMTASEDTSVSLFKIDGKSNEQMFTKKFKSYPIKCARFSPDGNQVIFTANKNNFNVLDLISSKVYVNNTIAGLPQGEKLSTVEVSPSGKQIVIAGLKGRLYIFDARSRVKTCSCAVSGSIESMTFSHDGQFLYLIGSGEIISVMDIRNTKVPYQRSWHDEGSVGGSSIAASPNDQWIATGSNSGVVNLYSWSETCGKEYPQPVKSVMNLTTPCSQLKFNSTSEILAMSSSNESRAVKLFHVTSRSVFSNFPERGKTLSTVTSMDFSPNSGYLCLGQQNGQASLYRLPHYSDY